MPDVIHGEIWDRRDFGAFCEWRMLYRCVEVGVDRGEFAQTFLERCYNCELYLGVDPYERYGEMDWDRTGDLMSASIKLERHAGKAKILKTWSQNAVESLKASESKLYQPPFDFVYIDGSHVQADVAKDLELWWPLLSRRGVLAGHDWSMSSGHHEGVQAAVTEFAARHRLTIHVTWKDDPVSFWMFKDGSAHPFEGRGR